LNDEVSSLAKLFSETAFLGDNRNFPHAHYGYLLACRLAAAGSRLR
jgi:hypothetical protein